MAMSKRGNPPALVSGTTYSDLKEMYDENGALIESSYYSPLEVKCPDDDDSPELIIQPILPDGMSCSFE